MIKSLLISLVGFVAAQAIVVPRWMSRRNNGVADIYTYDYGTPGATPQ
jgi:hypothetical protein